MPARVPIGCRLLTRLASWLLPRSQRGAWRARRLSHLRHWREVLMERGDWHPDDRAQLIQYCWSGFADAFWRRCDRVACGRKLRRFFGGPGFCLGAVASPLVLVALVTHGFSSSRTLFSAPPYAEPQRLVTCSLHTALGHRIGVPLTKVRLWQAHATTLSGLAAYRFSGPWARVTANFFAVLGVSAFLGRTLGPGDAGLEPPRIVLSYRLWEQRFGADPGVIGRKVTLEGKPLVVVGVLPPRFWFLSERLTLWTLLAGEGRRPALLGALGRLKPGARLEQAQAELRDLALLEPYQPLGHSVELHRLLDRFQRSRYLYGAGLALAFGLGLGAALARTSLGHGPLRYAWRYWLFFLLRGCLLLAALAGAWMEITTGATLRQNHLSDPVTAALFTGTFVLLSVGLFSVLLHDQRRRCPVCLRRLALPVRIGTWSSALLAPARVEWLCEQGHGAIYVPGAQLSASEKERWTALDESWRDLFV